MKDPQNDPQNNNKHPGPNNFSLLVRLVLPQYCRPARCSWPHRLVGPSLCFEGMKIPVRCDGQDSTGHPLHQSIISLDKKGSGISRTKAPFRYTDHIPNYLDSLRRLFFGKLACQGLIDRRHMSRGAHVRICEGVEVKLPCATRLINI